LSKYSIISILCDILYFIILYDLKIYL